MLNKYDALKELIKNISDSYALISCNTCELNLYEQIGAISGVIKLAFTCGLVDLHTLTLKTDLTVDLMCSINPSYISKSPEYFYVLLGHLTNQLEASK
jgi:hypothetical protein